MKEAIQKAIEGGWKPFTDDKVKKRFDLEEHYAIFYDSVNVRRYAFSDMFINPLFWQALGKSLGWEERDTSRETFWTKQKEGNVITLLDEWENKWHDFIDHLAEGGNAEEFFKELIK